MFRCGVCCVDSLGFEYVMATCPCLLQWLLGVSRLRWLVGIVVCEGLTQFATAQPSHVSIVLK